MTVSETDAASVPARTSTDSAGIASPQKPAAYLAAWLVAALGQDIDAIVKANRMSFEGLRAEVHRAVALINEAIGERRTTARVMAEFGPNESLRHLGKLALASLSLARADARELAGLTARSQRKSFDLVRRHIDERVDEVRRLLCARQPSG